MVPAYILKRSARKTLSMEITPALEVLVRAPMRLPLREIDAFVGKHTEWIRRATVRKQTRMLALSEPEEAELRTLTERARAVIPGRVSYYAQKMGLSPTAVKITRAKTRFGSCSPKNSLCFSCLLMRYPPEAIDYVVVHELAHIVHKNHGKAFHALVASVLPDHRERRSLLRQ